MYILFYTTKWRDLSSVWVCDPYLYHEKVKKNVLTWDQINPNPLKKNSTPTSFQKINIKVITFNGRTFIFIVRTLSKTLLYKKSKSNSPPNSITENKYTYRKVIEFYKSGCFVYFILEKSKMLINYYGAWVIKKDWKVRLKCGFWMVFCEGLGFLIAEQKFEKLWKWGIWRLNYEFKETC